MGGEYKGRAETRQSDVLALDVALDACCQGSLGDVLSFATHQMAVVNVSQLFSLESRQYGV